MRKKNPPPPPPHPQQTLMIPDNQRKSKHSPRLLSLFSSETDRKSKKVLEFSERSCHGSLQSL